MALIGNIKGPAGATGPAGPAGAAGTPGAAGTQIFTGTATPANTVGVDGDLFINTTSGDLLKKTAGTW